MFRSYFIFLVLVICKIYGQKQCPMYDPALNQLNEYFNNHSSEPPKVLALSSGKPVDNILNSLTAGPRGPMMLQDITFMESISRFDRERIPERVVHAKGAGAKGYFVVTSSEMHKFTRAALFSEVGKKTSIMVRFSMVVGNLGSADTARDIKGYALKFYTEEGNFDLVGLNVPIFVVNDPLKYVSFIHSQKGNPATNLPDENMIWDFYTLNVESLNTVIRLYSDLGTSDGYRHIDGFGINTFKLVNEKGKAVFCKFTWVADQGIKNLTAAMALKLAGEDPDYSTRDLYNAIAEKRYPSWTMYVQIMSEEEAEQYKGNPFDPTKEWLLKEFPLREIGKLVLNKNPSNFFAEVEQAAFRVSGLVPGIEASPDKVMQGRLFTYFDTEVYRLGANNHLLPVNRPIVPVTNLERDGFAMYTDNQDGTPNYFPSSFANRIGCQYAATLPYLVNGFVNRYEDGGDHYIQPRMFWNSLAQGDKNNLVENLASSLIKTKHFIQKRAVKIFEKLDPTLGIMLAKALNCTS